MAESDREGVVQSFPARTLRNQKTFIMEIGEDGFNAYIVKEGGERELFAASSSMSTWLKVMGNIVELGSGQHVEFQVVPKEEPCQPPDELRLALDSGNLPRAKVLQEICSKALDRAIAAQRRSISMLIAQIERGLKGEDE